MNQFHHTFILLEYVTQLRIYLDFIIFYYEKNVYWKVSAPETLIQKDLPIIRDSSKESYYFHVLAGEPGRKTKVI